MNNRVASMIDHTLLKAVATPEEIQKLCGEAKRYRFASVCVNPGYVKQSAKELAGSGVKVCTVIGFPLGATTTFAKAAETRDAIANGADEVDMLVEDVIKFRVEEIFTKVKDALDENNLGGTFREIVLTGGGANLRGMSEAAKIMLSESEERPIRTRIGYIKHDKIKECDLCRSQELMGAVGVLSYALLNGGLENDSEDDVKDELLYTAKKMTNKLLYKVKNLFN